MRITIDIDENKLTDILQYTGQKKKSPAIAKALDTYLREMRKQRLLNRVREGRTDYPLTNDALEARGEYDPD